MSHVVFVCRFRQTAVSGLSGHLTQRVQRSGRTHLSIIDIVLTLARVSRLDSGLCESLLESRASLVSALDLARARRWPVPRLDQSPNYRNIFPASRDARPRSRSKMQELGTVSDSTGSPCLRSLVHGACVHSASRSRASHIDNVVRALLPCVWSSLSSQPQEYMGGWQATPHPHTPRPRSHRCHAMPSCPRSTRMWALLRRVSHPVAYQKRAGCTPTAHGRRRLRPCHRPCCHQPSRVGLSSRRHHRHHGGRRRRRRRRSRHGRHRHSVPAAAAAAAAAAVATALEPPRLW